MVKETSYLTNFPVYRLTFKKDDLKPKHLMSIRNHKTINLSRLRKFNLDSRVTALLFPVNEDEDQVTVVFTKKKLPSTFYLDFVIVFTNTGCVYPLYEIENEKDFFKKVGEDFKHIYCGAVVDHKKVNTKILMETEDCLFKSNTSIRKWIDKKFGVKLPRSTKFSLEISYTVNPDRPFVLFNKRDEKDPIRHINKIKEGKVNNLILSKNSNTWDKHYTHLNSIYGQT